MAPVPAPDPAGDDFGPAVFLRTEVVPLPDETTQPFWDSLRRGQLRIQVCSQCDTYFHPPRLACPSCRTAHLVFRRVSGRGHIYTYTTSYKANVPGAAAPYTNLIVELVEQPNLFMLGSVPGVAPGWVVIGAPVRVAFDPVTSELTLAQFRADFPGSPPNAVDEG